MGRLKEDIMNYKLDYIMDIYGVEIYKFDGTIILNLVSHDLDTIIKSIFAYNVENAVNIAYEFVKLEVEE